MSRLCPLLLCLLLPGLALAHPPGQEPTAPQPPLAAAAADADATALPPEVREALLKARAENGGDGPRRIVLSAEQSAALSAMVKERQAAAQAMRKGRVFPHADLDTLDGGKVALRGKRTVVNFWATWCTPCLAEMPHFEQLAKDAPELSVVTINNDFDRADLDAWLAKRPLDLPVHFDAGNAIAAELGVRSWPTTLILDERGTIVDELHGEVKDYALLRSRLAVTPAP
jgi:thiol-disulfide isomerase/thioredoxin